MCDLILSILQCSNAFCYVLYCDTINTIPVKIIILMFTCQNKSQCLLQNSSPTLASMIRLRQIICIVYFWNKFRLFSLKTQNQNSDSILKINKDTKTLLCLKTH